jgi:hypothetical protein
MAGAPLTILSVLLNLTGFALFLATLPLTLELLVLSCAAALPARRIASRASTNFRLAVVIPAHNEERLIGTCVRSLLEDHETKFEVFVVAHNCTDRTAPLAAQAGARVLPLDGPRGKGLALDHGFRAALELGADAVLVIDADSIVSLNLLAAVSGALRAGAGAVQTRYQVANASTNVRTRLAALALFGMNVLRPRGRSRLGLSCGIFGNGFALSAATLRRVPYTANSLVEDLEYHLRLVEAGIKVEFLDHATVFGEMPERSAAASTQKARWEGGRALMRREWTPRVVRAVLTGRTRYLEPLLDLCALALATQVVLLGAATLLRLPWLLGYALAAWLGVLLYLSVSIALSPDPLESAGALVAAPFYIVWKLLLIPRTRLTAHKDAAWVRTQRNAEAAKQ